MELGANRNKLGRQIAPGIWEDGDGCLHFSIPDLLAMFELEDTPENHEIAKRNISEMLKQLYPDQTVIFRKTPDDKGTEL